MAISELSAPVQSPNKQMGRNDFSSSYELRDNSSARKNTNRCLSVLFHCDDASNTATEESILTKVPSNGGASSKIQKEEEGMSARQAYLPSKQQSHYGEEYGQNKEYIGGAHHCVVGELIWLSSDLVDIEADWEYEGSHTEEDHCGRGKTERRALTSPLDQGFPFRGTSTVAGEYNSTTQQKV